MVYDTMCLSDAHFFFPCFCFLFLFLFLFFFLALFCFVCLFVCLFVFFKFVCELLKIGRAKDKVIGLGD